MPLLDIDSDLHWLYNCGYQLRIVNELKCRLRIRYGRPALQECLMYRTMRHQVQEIGAAMTLV